MIQVQKTGIKVNGRVMSLEYFLLNEIERPLPKPPTHYVVADILNTDLSVKRVTIYFNPADTWEGNSSWYENTPQSVGMAIGDGLSFLNRDPNTLAYKFWIVDISTGEAVHKGRTYNCCKCKH